MCCRLPNFIEIGWFPLRYGALMICNIADIGHVDFSKFRLCMSRDLYRHAILLPCAKFHWNWAIGCWVMAQNIFKTAAVRHFEFLKNVLGSSGYHRSNFKCAVITKFNQNRIIFRWDMAILRQPSAILNLRNFDIMSRDLYRHAILLPCAEFYWNRTINYWVMAKNNFFKMAAVGHVNFKNVLYLDAVQAWCMPTLRQCEPVCHSLPLKTAKHIIRNKRTYTRILKEGYRFRNKDHAFTPEVEKGIIEFQGFSY